MSAILSNAFATTRACNVAGTSGTRRTATATISAARPFGSTQSTRCARLSLMGASRPQTPLSVSRPLGVATRASVKDAGPTGAKIIVQGRQLKITDAIREYCESKIGRSVAQFEVADGVRQVDVRCSVRGEASLGADLQKTEVTVYTKHGIVRAEEEGDNLYGSIDRVAEKVGRKLRKLKERETSKSTRHGKKAPKEVAAELQLMDDTEEEEEEEFDFGTIVREKFHPVQQMSVHRAVEEMEQVGHSFYAFRNKEDGEINIVYKRNAGGYGVLIPCDIDMDAAAEAR